MDFFGASDWWIAYSLFESFILISFSAPIAHISDPLPSVCVCVVTSSERIKAI